MLDIRPETSEDLKEISEVNREAFGGAGEARLVENIRDTDGFIPELSLVAVKDGLVVGHILFSEIQIKTDHDDRIPALSLAPLAVRPEFQDQGIGTLLIKKGLESCGELGHKIIVVIGHPGYYPRFGFIQARKKGLEVSFDIPIPDEAFMVREVESDSLNGVTGIVEFPPVFDEAIS